MTTHIYGLHDILDPEKTIQYVGKSQHLFNRLAYHKGSSFEHRPVRHWVKELKDNGSAPAMVVLQSTEDEDKAAELEREWITRLKPLCNRQGLPKTPKSQGQTKMNLQQLFAAQNRDILVLLFNNKPLS